MKIFIKKYFLIYFFCTTCWLLKILKDKFITKLWVKHSFFHTNILNQMDKIDSKNKNIILCINMRILLIKYIWKYLNSSNRKLLNKKQNIFFEKIDTLAHEKRSELLLFLYFVRKRSMYWSLVSIFWKVWYVKYYTVCYRLKFISNGNTLLIAIRKI